MAKEAGKSRQPKKGFSVGPRLAKGSYDGHLKKIKQTLIHKAQVKRKYYKELARDRPASIPSAPVDDGEAAQEVATSSSGPRSKRPPTAAFQKHDAAQAAPKKKKQECLTEEEVEALRARRKEEKGQWGRRRANGQPDMGSRVGVLLKKIQRDHEQDKVRR